MSLDTTDTNDPIGDMTLADEEVRNYHNEGWILLPGLLREDSIASIRDDILDVVSDLGTKESELLQASSTAHKLIQTSQYLVGHPLDRLVNSARLNAVAARLLGGPCSIYQPFTAVKSARGGGEFHFHQDNNYTRFSDGMHGINFWFALVDMTPENGCLCIEPRTHTEGTLGAANVGQGDHHVKIEYNPKSYLPVRMRAGDAVVFSRLTVHGSGENISDHPRVGYSVQFNRDDAMASWDGQAPRPLKTANRWRTGPVEEISVEAQGA